MKKFVVVYSPRGGEKREEPTKHETYEAAIERANAICFRSCGKVSAWVEEREEAA